MSEKIQFEQLNSDWNAEPNAPEVEIAIAGNDLMAIVPHWFSMIA